MPRRTRSRLAQLREHLDRTRWRDTQALEAYRTLLDAQKPGTGLSVIAFDAVLKDYYKETDIALMAYAENAMLSFFRSKRATMKIVDEDIIRQKAVSNEYRDGWERMFGDKNAESETKDADAIECKITTWMNVQPPPVTVTFGGNEPMEVTATDPDAFTEIKNRRCDCDLRDRQWNGFGKCLHCGGKYDDRR